MKIYISYCVSVDNFGKNLSPKIWAKMLSSNQIAVFLKERNLQNKSMKLPDFLHVDTSSKKLNFV